MATQQRNRNMSRQQAPTRSRYCHFCVNGINDIDYKDTVTLKRYTSSYAKIVPKRKSGACASHQRQLSQAIKRARFMALLAFVAQ